MPYYLHAHNDPPESGTPYTDKHDAVSNREANQTVSFVASNAERETWMQRERRRLTDRVYMALPWLNDGGYPSMRYRNRQTPTPFYNVTVDQLGSYYALSQFHFAHVSLKSDAMIAYTPSDEHGMADRQTRIRCGKYLDLVAPWLEPFQKDQLCAMIRSMCAVTFKLAITPSDVRAVYRAGKGFQSCMDGRNFPDDDDTNPVSVYGNSDLAVAYLGDLDSDEPRVTARSVVWPEKKIYTRIYGDELLACLLKADGWTDPGWEENETLAGARIRAIRNGRCYVMPYIDSAATVSLTSDEKHFYLCSSDDRGEFSCRETDGVTGRAHPEYMCDHCGNEHDDENELDCASCRDAMWSCRVCEEYFYADDEFTIVTTDRGYTWRLCDACADRTGTSCEHCGDTFYPDTQYSQDTLDRRERDRVTEYCEDCAAIVLVDREAEDSDTSDDPTTPVPIVATNDTDMIPLPFVASTHLPFRDIPIGTSIRVIEIPHHTGTKTADRSIRWNACDSPGHALCHCGVYRSVTMTDTIPLDKLYEVC